MSKPENNEPDVMTASEVRQHFSEVVNRVARGEGRVIVEKNGAPAVGMVSMADVRRLENYEAMLARRRQGLNRIQSFFDEIPGDEWEREVEQAFDELREERRASHRRDISAAS